MKFVSVIALAAFLLRTGSARGAQSGPTTINGIAVKVNDTVVTFQEIDDEIDENALRRLSVRYERQPQAFQQELEKLRSDRVQLLVERQLILDEFRNAGYKLPESFVNEEVKHRIRTRFYDNRVTMIKSLEHEGMTEQTFRQRIREEIILAQMEYKNISAGTIIISPHKIETYYALNAEKFKVEDEVKLRMIFLPNKPDRDAEATRKLAEEILGRIKGGAAFAAEASTHSEDSYKAEGGLRPAEDRKTLREDLAKVAFALKPGETSDVLERDDGCYLMKVEEFRPAHVKPLSEARAEIERTLESEDRQRLRKEWMERLKAKSFISYILPTDPHP
jgi:peptidyl-prolyl cis-trans isomerase SurA